MFSGLAAQAVSSKVLLRLEVWDFVSGWVDTLAISSKVLVEAKEEQEEGRGEGGATFKGFFSSCIIFCTGCFSPVCVTFLRRKSANEAAGLLVSGDAGDAGGPGGEMGAGGGGKVKECSCRSFLGGELDEGGSWTIERTLGRTAATKACLLQ